MTTTITSPALDWNTLAQQTAPYTSTLNTKDPVSGLTDVTWCGLRTRLSDVLQGQPASGLHSIAIFADTLVVDVPSITTSGLLLVVRSLDITSLQGQPLLLNPPSSNQVVAQVLVGGATGGAFRLALSEPDSPAVTPPVGTDTPLATIYIGGRNEPLSELPAPSADSLAKLLGYSWTMNSLYASFTAAAWLVDDVGNPLSQTTAQAMLSWVVHCTASLVSGSQLSDNFSQLYNQAAALLVTQNLAPGATFVPALSSTYYNQHMQDVIAVIRNYEGQLQTLDTRQDIAQAIATVSATLQSVASDEIGPLQVQIDNINANTQSLFGDIIELRSEFQLQTQRSHTAFEVLQTEIAIGTIKKQLAAEMDMAMSVMSLGFDAAKIYAGDASALKDAIEHGVGAIKGLVDTIEAGQSPGGDDLSGPASTLLTSQMALMNTYLNGALLWQQALKDQSGGVLPSDLAAVTIDPVLDWDNYIIAAEAKITSLQRELPGDSARAAADVYLASLKILAGYGKAIGGKFVAYIAQMVKATVILAQIKAAKQTEARWKDTQARATSDAEKLAALRGLVQSRMESAKRALYVAWTYYAASYYYLNFQTPPRTVRLGMDSAALQAALVGVAEWVAAALGNAPDGKRIQLPSDNASIELDFAILPTGGKAPDGDVALLDKTSDGGWQLTFTVPLGTAQLNGVLPNNGRCAIWISQAQFFIDGIKPNSKGNVIATVSTSGTYQNGTDPAASETFVTKGMSGNYAYRAADQQVYSPWAINTAVYMTPTPYTQWTIALPPGSGDPSTASRLRVALSIAYLS